MAPENDEWKSKYQTALRELDEKEQQWSRIEDTLRKGISRLSLAARGLDEQLDEQLKLIQTFSKEKRDESLAEALSQLSTIISNLDQPSTDSAGQYPESMLLLMETLQEINLNTDQQQRLKPLCADLLKSVATKAKGSKLTPEVTGQIKQISALINENREREDDTQPSHSLVTQLIGLLNLSAEASTEINQILDNNRELQQAELAALANTINTFFESNTIGQIPIDVAITQLLNRLGDVDGMDNVVNELRNKISDSPTEDQWIDSITLIVESISIALQQLDHDKRELEGFIVNITNQLGQLSELIEVDLQEKSDEHDHAREFHDYLHEGINSLEAGFRASSNLDDLKESISHNIQFIRKRVDEFVHETHERFEATEKRNQQLSSKIAVMEHETQELQVKLQENREKLVRDPLTGVFNRLAYEQQMLQEIARWERYHTPFSFALLDIDHFKKINDDYGHAAGDKALVIVARLMTRIVRKTDLIYRIGGEEFVIILPGTNSQQAGQLVDKIRQSVSETEIHFKQTRVEITLSAGYTAVRNGDSKEMIFDRTDAAMYRAKNSGRNRQYEAQ